MKSVIAVVLLGVFLAGCAQMCEFGEAGGESGLKCFRVFNKAVIGMTQEEVSNRLGSPARRRINLEYKGKIYDEVWVYETVPSTILYFKNGVLEHKEYQQ